MNVVAQMTAKLAWPKISPTAMNWAEPAKTASDIKLAMPQVEPGSRSRAPKIDAEGRRADHHRSSRGRRRSTWLRCCCRRCFQDFLLGQARIGARAAGTSYVLAASRVRPEIWNAPSASVPAARRVRAEMPREMALVGEAAARGRDLRHRYPRAQRAERASRIWLRHACGASPVPRVKSRAA